MVNTFSLGTKKSNGCGRNEGGDTIGEMIEFNYGDGPIKMTTMILWQAPVDISSLNHREGSLYIVIHSYTFGELISREYVVLALRWRPWTLIIR